MAERSTIRGVVGRADYAGGSKGERRVATLTTEAGTTFVLRQIGANPYDDAGDAWVDGASIEAIGYVHRDTFLVESFETADRADTLVGEVRESPRPGRVGRDGPQPSSPPRQQQGPR